MWRGVFPAVTTKFTEDDRLDTAELERCFALQVEAGVDGIIVCGSLGEAMALEPEEKLEILKIAKAVAGKLPVLMTISESSTRRAVKSAEVAAKAGADGFMVLPGVPYRSAPHETVAHMLATIRAGGLPAMIYNNPISYGVDISLAMFEELAKEPLVVAMKELTDEIRRVTDVINHFGDRFDVFTGVDNLALESIVMGACGWVAGLVVAFPKETVAIWNWPKRAAWKRRGRSIAGSAPCSISMSPPISFKISSLPRFTPLAPATGAACRDRRCGEPSGRRWRR